MNAPEALRSIRYDWLSYIQERISVEFNNTTQEPVHFTHKQRCHRVHEVLGRFRVRDDGLLNGFLIEADDGEVYFLYFQKIEPERGIGEGCWVLSFKILSDTELMALYRDDRKMLVDMTVKRVVDFHGHLCPELVIGMKVCEYAQEVLFKGEQPSGRISIIAENCTSALDALQVLLGVTMGNQGLKVFDFGKHNYTFSRKNAEGGFTLTLKTQTFGDEHQYAILEERILGNQITLDEVVHFQQLLDARVAQLLAIRPEDLFDVETASQAVMTMETPTAYVACAGCGQQVLKERAVVSLGNNYCVPCCHALATPKAGQSLH